jgi:hypothetical protein
MWLANGHSISIMFRSLECAQVYVEIDLYRLFHSNYRCDMNNVDWSSSSSDVATIEQFSVCCRRCILRGNLDGQVYRIWPNELEMIHDESIRFTCRYVNE